MAFDSANMLYYLDILLKHGNFTKAAKDLYISQPYLTQLIKRTEKELDITIINRQTSPLQLTEAGRLYYQYLYTLEAEQDKFRKKISQYSSNEQQVLRLGVLSSLGTFLIPLFLPDFVQKHPNIKVELHEDTPAKNEEKLLSGEIDFFIGQNPETISPNLTIHPYGKHRYYAVIPKSSPFYQAKTFLLEENSLSIKQLLKEKLILTTRGSAIRKQIDYLIQQHKIDPTIVLESNNIFTVVELAINNAGITFIPESIKVNPQPDKFNLYPIPLKLLSLDYFIAHQATRTLIAEENAFIQLFLTNLAKDIVVQKK
ncbi:LysR family transcriptional regulator [Enterococcus aquimarinus]|uniref:HTH lysR-type domain-containing protein n=1 Tax=Enterococcus aquimarinus TaxID=328396 RepID=A0A1L8QRG1_9ENTE|nr:LysR family transcriptional regulator [Enterococcus aquimarinus]OJG10105.1 hypothetical protein RU93_GL000355 [Enterococcus aquimarinus]